MAIAASVKNQNSKKMSANASHLENKKMRTEYDFTHNKCRKDRTKIDNAEYYSGPKIFSNERTWLGYAMYSITKFFSNILIKHMWLYYILNYTWGLIMTLLGWLVYLFVKVFLRYKICDEGKFGGCHYLMLGHNWGGLSIGVIFLIAAGMGELWTYHTKCHEVGHTFQNAIWGPFAIFLIYIPSVVRYWYQAIRSKHGKPNVEYDCFWVEESATDIGTKFILEGYWH